MANCKYSFDEIRFDVRDPQITHVWVFLSTQDPTGLDCPHMVQGWHHHTFPARIPTIDLLKKEVPDAVMWPLEAPPDTALSVETLRKDRVREALAAYAHEAWSGWMRYQFSRQVLFQGSGGVSAMSDEDRARWTRQMHTSYQELSDGERASDHMQADNILTVLAAALQVPTT
jgi:hypothetical protein